MDHGAPNAYGELSGGWWWTVTLDRNRIIQVLSNLIGNALKFTPGGGRIAVSACRFGDEVRFSVADSGPGIPEAEQGHVFDRYWQAAHARHGGTGLGLFIVKGIVEAHHGHVWVAEASEGGASLCFTLPASEQAPLHAGAPA